MVKTGRFAKSTAKNHLEGRYNEFDNLQGDIFFNPKSDYNSRISAQRSNNSINHDRLRRGEKSHEAIFVPRLVKS